MGAEPSVHDPYVDQWWEFKNQELYPANSKHVFFRNQKKLQEIEVQKDLDAALKDIDCLVFAVRHEAYLNLDPDEIIKKVGHSIAVVDCFGVLDDQQIKRYFELGCEVKGLGRGHIGRIKKSTKL